jgi:hypothetical protein
MHNFQRRRRLFMLDMQARQFATPKLVRLAAALLAALYLNDLHARPRRLQFHHARHFLAGCFADSYLLNLLSQTAAGCVGRIAAADLHNNAAVVAIDEKPIREFSPPQHSPATQPLAT